MAITPIKALLFLAGGTAAAGATAYVSGALDPYLAPPAQIASLPPATDGEADPKDNRLPGTEPPAAAAPAPEKPAEASAPAQPPADPAAPAPYQPAPPAVVAPSFDVVRVEADGSLVIAGKAAAGAKVEVLTGSRLLGRTKADAAGSFVVVLDEPLKPGDYQIVLRATDSGNVIAMSVETAIVSIPESKDGQVLAMVEEPGKPAEVISVPQPAAPAAPAAETPAAPAAEAPAAPAAEAPATAEAKPAEDEPAEQAEAAAAPEPQPAPEPQAPAVAASVTVDAVEIEGSRIFVAGAADPGRKLRGYADDILLGDATASPDGRFLIEADRELPVGTYTIRVDALEADGKVAARAAVPFEREPGEAIAAIAPPAPPAKPAAPAAEPAPEPAAPAAEPAPEPAAPAAEAQAPAPAKPEGEESAAAPAPAEAPAPPPADVPEVTAPKLQSVDGAVIIRRGDTLWRISRRVYGKGVRYSTIYLANQTQITDPDRIWPGQVFKVPEKSEDGAPADMTGMGEQATTVQ